MRKVAIVFLFVFVFSTVVFAEEFDFRHARWGMSVKEVRGSESSRLLKKEGDKKEYRLVYSTDLSGRNGRIEYTFVDYKLRKAQYRFMYEESVQALAGYRNFKTLLVEKYGKAADVKRIYSEEKKEKFGLFSFVLLLPLDFFPQNGIEKGQLVLKTLWVKDFTYVSLSLCKEHDKYAVAIDYEHKRWADDRQREEEERRLQRGKELYDSL
jgi:hypothetical protein